MWQQREAGTRGERDAYARHSSSPWCKRTWRRTPSDRPLAFVLATFLDPLSEGVRKRLKGGDSRRVDGGLQFLEAPQQGDFVAPDEFLTPPAHTIRPSAVALTSQDNPLERIVAQSPILGETEKEPFACLGLLLG